jgi:hypothetical protein
MLLAEFYIKGWQKNNTVELMKMSDEVAIREQAKE